MAAADIEGKGSAIVLIPDVPTGLLASLADADSQGPSAPPPDPPKTPEEALAEQRPRGAKGSSDAVRWSQADILVVDDDDDVRSSMATVLRSVGYRVVEASDGQSALDVLVGTDVAVIVLDLHMTPRDGVWLLEHMEATPVILVVSAFALYNEASMRQRYGGRVAAFLRKPVAPPRLIEAIRRGYGPATNR